MSQFYDQASLVMIPSGYKNGKVYSQKPLSADGELTFTRASNATRVNADGLIEKVRTNYLLQSNTFNTTWSNNLSGSITGGQTGYDGTNDAWLLEKSGAFAHIQQSTTNSGVQTFSVYAKSGTFNWVRLRFSDATTYNGQYFDLSNGVKGSTEGTLIDSNITSVGNDWFRCDISINTTLVAAWIYPVPSDNGAGSSTAGSIYIQNAQLETGDIPTDYIPTTTAAVSVGPVSGLPRLDYSGGASCPSLLLEPTATALNQFSEQLDNAYWTKANCTVTANQVVSPSGYADADLVLDDTSNNQHVITRSIAVTSGNKYTSSFFLKPAGHTTAAIRMGNGSLWTGGTGPTVEFDLVALTGTVVDGSGVTFSIEDYGNGWVRCAVTGTCVTNGNTVYSLYVKQYNAYIGNGTSGIYAWGGNITATGYVQSYIPTLSTAVTRVADSASKTGISSLIGQTEGTLFAELKISSNDSTFKFLSLSDGTTSNSVWIYYRDTDNQINFRVIVGGVSQFDQIYTSPDSTTTHKLAIKYKQNDFSAWFNGTKVLTDTSGNTFSGSTLSEFDFFRPDGVNHFYGNIKQVLLFKTALTDAELAELTTL